MGYLRIVDWTGTPEQNEILRGSEVDAPDLVIKTRRQHADKRGRCHDGEWEMRRPRLNPRAWTCSPSIRRSKHCPNEARQVSGVDLRFFGGRGTDEAAVALGISPATVEREWALAKAWLYRRLL